MAKGKTRTFMVMASLYEARIINGLILPNGEKVEPNWDHKILRMGPKVILRGWAESQNEAMVKDSTVIKRWEFDEEATKEFYKEAKIAKEKRDVSKELRKKNAEAFQDTLMNLKTT